MAPSDIGEVSAQRQPFPYDVRETLGDGLSLLGGRRLHHDPHEGLGAGGAEEDAAGVAEQARQLQGLAPGAGTGVEPATARSDRGAGLLVSATLCQRPRMLHGATASGRPLRKAKRAR